MGLALPLGNPLIRSVKQGIKRAHVEKGTDAESEKATDVGYADENAREHSLLGCGGKGGMDRLGVVLFSDVAGIGIVRGGEGGVPLFLLFAEGGCGVLQK